MDVHLIVRVSKQASKQQTSEQLKGNTWGTNKIRGRPRRRKKLAEHRREMRWTNGVKEIDKRGFRGGEKRWIKGGKKKEKVADQPVEEEKEEEEEETWNGRKSPEHRAVKSSSSNASPFFSPPLSTLPSLSFFSLPFLPPFTPPRTPFTPPLIA